ncbi:GbsR/MarR family transcriptional regulator [Alcaligenes faecalis]|jgi:DNA-binding transcriptional regulator GbsR (MarR family)|uniref:HTH-type transcriptional regulator n=1 Tax=Alcaligenes faecalis TaxID=511 RepID=A0A0M9IAN0_ALCFA|nr:MULTISPECIES: GbsR/MarR family transcriptional regulator [Alcaligenes]MDK7584425.1 GbsR/MarR family transcriptional regulator [Alcaligenes phenolicus]ALO39125.1 ArsR family transcriptional regulator [Alcaligenes faecalis]ARP55117.1 ArsR family transcriptional regulator [Alcaligenes faecalis]ATI00957.1 GbsR/MarR family transcriptional regulator [Alcaligenes faecalis]AYZ90316.1 GbsR/MarR family transcriptional regulator [Alcaligenes faecalis]
MNLGPQAERFILHFGEMGGRWGVNRTVGQIYALLFIAPEALHADEIAETLGISRSNVSMSLRELQSWRLVNMTHKIGERREYFESPKDVWDIFRTLVEEKRKREIDPTLTLLRSILMEAPVNEEEEYGQQRINEMLELIELACGWFDEVHHLPPETLQNLMRLGSKVQKVLGFAGKIRKADQTGGRHD